MLEALEPSRLRCVYDRVARHYDRQHSVLTLGTDDRGRRLVVEHGVQEGDQVLDAGGGTGITSIRAARKVGPEGHVTVYDLSPRMVAMAQKKAEEAGLADRMAFQTGDMLVLPFEDGTFDVVLSTYSLCPVYDPEAGILELYRVVKPGGRLAVAHSAEPRNALVRGIAHGLERLVWRFPRLTLGCRPVSTLPALEKAGASIEFQRRIGIPLYPFLVYVAGKPA